MILNKYQRKFIDILTDLDPLDLQGMRSIAKQFRSLCLEMKRKEKKEANRRYKLKKKLKEMGILL